MADLPRGLRFRHLDAVRPIRILDLGCGVGYGSAILAAIPKSCVMGIDVSDEAIQYALLHYQKANVEYRVCDIRDFVNNMDEWDYIVAAEVIEHIVDGFDVLLRLQFKKRLLTSTPYDEPIGRDKHHRLFNIVEGNYTDYPCREFFYQTLGGDIYDDKHKPDVPVNLLCVISQEQVVRVRALHIPRESLVDRYWRLVGEFRRKCRRQSCRRYLLRRLLPDWVYGSLRSIWHGVKGMKR